MTGIRQFMTKPDDLSTGKAISVRPHGVAYIEAAEGASTRIHFIGSKDNYVVVRAKYEDVMSWLIHSEPT